MLGLVLTAAAAVAGIMVLEGVIRRTDLGAGLVVALLLLEESGILDTALDVGALRIQATDVIFALLLAAAVARLLRVTRLTTAQRLLVLFGLLTIWALVRGAGPFGVPAAVNEARKFLWFTGVALYFATAEVRRDLMDRIGRLLLLAAAVLAMFTVARWVGAVAGLSGSFFGRNEDLRVLPAAMALLVSQVALIALPFLVGRRPGWRRFIAPVLLVLVVLLQHRTVWLVTALGAALLVYRERAIARRAFTVVLAVVMLLTALSFTLFDDPDIQLSDQLASSAQSTATFEWRYEGWRALLVDTGPEGPDEVFTGKPFGSGWGRTLPNGRAIESHIQPHNFYVETVLRVGAIGLLLLFAIYAVGLRNLTAGPVREPTGSDLLSPTVLYAIIAVQLLYYITYAPDVAQGMLLGLGLAAGRVEHRRAQLHRSRLGERRVSA